MYGREADSKMTRGEERTPKEGHSKMVNSPKNAKTDVVHHAREVGYLRRLVLPSSSIAVYAVSILLCQRSPNAKASFKYDYELVQIDNYWDYYGVA